MPPTAHRTVPSETAAGPLDDEVGIRAVLDAADDELARYRAGDRALRAALRYLPPASGDVDEKRTLHAAARVEHRRRAAQAGWEAAGGQPCRCTRCRRPLTAPTSTARGLGPVCHREMRTE